MRALRGGRPDLPLTSGPARLCQALDIALRRRVLVGLNKGESYQALARSLVRTVGRYLLLLARLGAMGSVNSLVQYFSIQEEQSIQCLVLG